MVIICEDLLLKPMAMKIYHLPMAFYRKVFPIPLVVKFRNCINRYTS